MNKIKLKDFKIGDIIEFIKEYNAQHPVEYYAYIPSIPKGTKGIVSKVTDSAIHVKIKGVDNLVTLWDNKSFPGEIQDRIDCIRIIGRNKR